MNLLLILGGLGWILATVDFFYSLIWETQFSVRCYIGACLTSLVLVGLAHHTGWIPAVDGSLLGGIYVIYWACSPRHE